MNFKRIIPAVIAAAAIAVPAGASAAPLTSPANPDAQCGTAAGSGSFGFFGQHGETGFHDQGLNKGDGPINGTIGANGPGTGANNSAICGR